MMADVREAEHRSVDEDRHDHSVPSLYRRLHVSAKRRFLDNAGDDRGHHEHQEHG
jgi:hypothetical protein